MTDKMRKDGRIMKKGTNMRTFSLSDEAAEIIDNLPKGKKTSWTERAIIGRYEELYGVGQVQRQREEIQSLRETLSELTANYREVLNDNRVMNGKSPIDWFEQDLWQRKRNRRGNG